MNQAQITLTAKDVRAKATIARLEAKLTGLGVATRTAQPTFLDTAFKVAYSLDDKGAMLTVISPSIDKLDTIESQLIDAGETLLDRYQFKNGLKSFTVKLRIAH